MSNTRKTRNYKGLVQFRINKMKFSIAMYLKIKTNVKMFQTQVMKKMLNTIFSEISMKVWYNLWLISQMNNLL